MAEPYAGEFAWVLKNYAEGWLAGFIRPGDRYQVRIHRFRGPCGTGPPQGGGYGGIGVYPPFLRTQGITWPLCKRCWRD